MKIFADVSNALNTNIVVVFALYRIAEILIAGAVVVMSLLMIFSRRSTLPVCTARQGPSGSGAMMSCALRACALRT